MAGWTRADRIDRDALLGFLLPREPACIAVTSRIARDADKRVFLDSLSGHVYLSDSGEIDSALFHTRGGLVLPVFPHDCGGSEISLAEQYRKLLPSRIHSILGTERSVRVCERLFPAPPSARVEYYLMTAEASAVPRLACPEGLSVSQAMPDDGPLLFKLQFDYESEEVVIDREAHDPEVTMAHLRKNLSVQTILYAKYNGILVAKGGTNAKGHTCHQLGGIYTLPEYRSRGIAQALVSRLCSLIAFDVPRVSLFVKVSNPAAIAVYRRLGFETIDRFRISYYRRG